MAGISIVSHLVNDIRDVLRGRTPAHSHLRNRLKIALSVTLIVDLVAATLLYYLEHKAKGSDISTWWGFVLFHHRAADDAVLLIGQSGDFSW